MINKKLMLECLRDRAHVIATVLSGVLGGLSGVAQAFLLAWLIAAVSKCKIGIAEVSLQLLLLLTVIVLRGGLNWLEERSALFLGGSVQQNLRQKLLEKIDAFGPIKMREQRYGELLTILTEGLDALESYFQKYLPQLFKSALLPVFYLIIIFPLDWPTGLIMILSAPLVPLFMSLIGQWTNQHTLKQWQVLSQMGGYFQDIFEGLSTLKLFNHTAGQKQKIAAQSESFRITNLAVLKWGFLSAFVLEILTTISIAMIAVGLGLRLVYGTLDFQRALFLLFLAPEFYQPLRSLGTQYHNSLNGAAVAKNIFALLEEDDDFIGDGFTGYNGDATIVFNNVCFAYEKGREVLSDVGFTLTAGEKIGIIGGSGSGKTTLLHLLAGYIRPDRGTISMGGQNLTDLGAKALRQQISFVSQNPYLFKGSLMENILMGNRTANSQTVINLCKELGVHEMFLSLPLGYDTLVGQGGQLLSGGERQMLAIARACLKDSPLILLDEATRNIDWQHDFLLQQAIVRLSRDKTVIAIAHRLPTLAGMDRILVLEEGRILKIGSPAEIIDGLPVLGYDIHGTTNNSDELCRSCPTTPSSSSSAILSSNLPYLATSLPNSPLSASSQTIASSKHSLITRMLDLCRPYAALISGSCLLSASAIVANIALLGFSSLLICCASLSPPLLDLMLIIVAVRFFGISRAVLRYIERYISHDITLRILAKLRLWYYEQMEKLSYVSLQKLGLGRVFKHIIGDVDTLKFFYLRVLTVPLIAFIVWAAASIFLSMYSWKLVCLLSVFFVSGGIICPCLLRFALTRRRQGFSALRQDYSEALYDYINGLADRQIYDDKKECLQKIEKQGHNLANERYYIGIWEGFASTLTSFLANLALFAALAIMITQVAQGISNGLVLASIVWVIWAAFEALQPVTTMMEYLNQSRAALKGMEEAATRPQEPPRLGKAMLMAENGLVVEHLCFSYADDKPLLEDISFRLAPGSKTALLGNSGAGKTTLLNLLSGFLPYEKGRILNGETELNEVSATYLRQHIGYLEQKPYFFHASIRENIILAKKDTTEQELLSVLKKARLDEFINNLPMGLDTLVGENGYKLSAGQRQRLALARLFLQDAPLVILDEPTQSLDKENRASLFATLCEWWADKTVLYVTHDSFGLAVMDNIIFMEQGRLTEQGSEKELLQKGGKYMMNIMKYI